MPRSRITNPAPYPALPEGSPGSIPSFRAPESRPASRIFVKCSSSQRPSGRFFMGSTSLIALIMPLMPQTARAASTADAISAMEKQIHAMQQQLSDMKKKQAAENRRISAELARQRMLIEADPYSIRARLMNNGPGMAISESGHIGKSPVYRDLFGVQDTALLAPSRTALTPYGEITATPPAHPDLYGPLRRGQFQLGGIRITLGGYLEADTIWRSRNTGSDIATGYNAIPWKNNPAHYMSEFHQSERQSRLATLVEGMLTKEIEADGYIETDFQSSGSSSNSRQSSSYTLRTRVFYGEVKDRKDGWYFLGGQNWSLLTLFNKGMFARNEQTPLVIEAQYVPGFNWTRSTQIRFVKTFGQKEDYAFGLSVENPSAVPAGTAWTAKDGKLTDRVPGANINNPDTWYSTDPAPDIIAKMAADPGWGHYELTGIMRFFRTRTSMPGRGSNHTIIAGGGGGGMVLPLIDKKLYFQASGLAGRGLGRYGTASMPDFTYNQQGRPVSLPEANLLLGLYGDLSPAWRLYAYGGAEQVLHREGFNVDGTAYGYGNRNSDMSGCSTELATNCAASGNLRRVAQATTGFWYTAAKGDYGTLRVGGQYSHTWVQAFSGLGEKPKTDADMVFMSLRYMPFN